MIIFALAGVQSQRPSFNDQRALFDDIYHLRDWLWEGRSVIRSSPETLDNNFRGSWEYLLESHTKWNWLQFFFNDEEDFKISLVTYYMLLSFNEYIFHLNQGKFSDETPLELEKVYIPLTFSLMGIDICSKAFSRLSREETALLEIMERKGVTAQEVKDSWNHWIEVCANWIEQYLQENNKRVPHHDLIKIFD